MNPTDWIFSSVIFVGIVVALFVFLPVLLPELSAIGKETKIAEVLDSITDDIEVQVIVVKSDCNEEIQDCSQFFPVMIKVSEGFDYLFSRPFAKDSDNVYSVMGLGAMESLFTLTPGRIEEGHDKNLLDLEVSALGKVINVKNSFIDVNVTDSNASIRFRDSDESDMVLRFPEISLELLKDTKELVIIGNEEKNFRILFFPNTSEFWLDVPDDIPVTIAPKLKNWQVGEHSGALGENAWWDYRLDDDEWWHYRMPITVNSLDCSGSNIVMRQNIDFSKVKEKLNIDAKINNNSFRVVEYGEGQPIDHNPDTNEIEPVPFHMEFDSETEKGELKWQLTGNTDSNSIRLFFLYFDFEPFPKSKPVYSDLEYSDLGCRWLVSTGSGESLDETQKVFVSGEAFIFNPTTYYISVIGEGERSWAERTARYRIPFSFSAGNHSRQDISVSANINFTQEFLSVGCNECDLNTGSVYFAEVKSLAGAEVIDTLEKGSEWGLDYNSETKTAEHWFTVKGTTAAGATRYYYLYYASE